MVCILLLTGCNSADKTLRYKDMRKPGPEVQLKSMVIGGPEGSSLSAFAESERTLTEADWKVLEKYAPRSDWQQVIELRKTYRKARVKKLEEQAKSKNTAPAPTRNIPVVQMPDGKVQIYYRLWHYGGAKVQTALGDNFAKPKITVTDPKMESLLNLVAAHLAGKGEVKPLPSENMLIITCPADQQASVLQLLDQVDQQRKQVEITVRIFEVSDDFDFQMGVKTMVRRLGSNNSQAFLGAFDIVKFAGQVVDPLGGTVPGPGSALSLMNLFSKSGVGVDITFQALAESGLIKVVSSPRMTVAAGQKAFMMAGQELPIREGRLSNDKFITEKISYKPIGVQLYITPQTIGDNSVKMHMLTIVSAVSGFAPLPTLNEFELNSSIVNPILDTRQAETHVEVPDGSTLVVGGLRMVRRVRRESKVPFMGDAPVVGWLFKNNRSQRQMSDLYFFVTPKIVDTDGQPAE